MKRNLSLFVLLLASAAHAQPDAVFDQSFGANGVAQFDNIDQAIDAISFAIQNDSKIVVADIEAGPTLVASRMNIDGTIDTTFGVSGKVTIDQAAPLLDVSATCMAINSAQDIIIATYAAGNTVEIYSLNRNGALKSSFNQGAVGGIPAVTAGIALPPSIAIADDGSIYLVLKATADSGVLLVKLTKNGLVDQSFNSGGTPGYLLILDTDNSDGGFIALTRNNQIRIAFYRVSSFTAVVVGVTNDGLLDASFGVAGFADTLSNFAPGEIKITGLGKILIGGIAPADTTLLMQLNKNGTVDSGFGDNGVAAFVGFSVWFEWFAVRSNGEIDCALYSGQGPLVLRRLSSNGILNSTFDWDFPYDYVNHRVGIDALGRLIVVSSDPLVAPERIIVLRLLMESLRYSPLSQALWRRYYNRI